MVSDSDKLTSFLKTRQINRRSFLLSSIAALAVTGCSNDEGASISTTLSNGSGIAAAPTEAPPIPIQGINHMTLGVSDPAASLAWYQGLFGMPISARIGGTTVLQIGAVSYTHLTLPTNREV